MENRAKQICSVMGTLEGNRSTWEGHCQEAGRYLLQRNGDFQTQSRTEGQKRNHYEFDSTANRALERFAAAMDSILTPRTQQWHRLQAIDPDLQKIDSVKRYYDDITKLLFRTRYSTKSNFAAQQIEGYLNLGAWGMASKIITDDPENAAIRYKSVHCSELFVLENMHGIIDTVYRKYELTCKQAIEQFGEGNVSPSISKQSEKDPSKKFWFVHAISPNPKYVEDSLNPDEFKYRSEYVELDKKEIVSTGGFRTFPIPVSRYATATGETYGRSIAMSALADIKTLNAMGKTQLKGGQLAIEPPLLLHDDGVMNRFHVKPNALNYGGVDGQGRKLVHPLNNGARLDFNEAGMDKKREAINDAFFVTLFQILVDNPRKMTATEVLERAEEKGVLLGPMGARQETEDLGMMIERELDILGAANQLPPPPPELIEAGSVDYEVYYTSPLARAQRAQATLGMQRTVEQAMAVYQIDPMPARSIDFQYYIREFGDSQGAPAELFKLKEQVEADMAAEKQQQQMQQAVQAGPQVASAIKDIAQAQMMGRS